LFTLAASLFALTSATVVHAQSSDVARISTDAASEHDILVMLRLSPDHYRPNSNYGGDYGDRRMATARRRLAQQIADRYGLSLVKDGWPMPLLGLDCYVMRVPADQSVEHVAEAVSKAPQVAWSQPVQTYRAKAEETHGPDPLFVVQPTAKAWRLAELHKVATGRGITVAIVDSRIEITHPDLVGQFVADQDFVVDHPSAPERHGTGVAGVIAAKEGNGIGIAGVAPDARLMALRACWQSDNSLNASTVCDSLSLAKAIHFAIDHRAAIINLSLAGPPDRLLAQLIDIATARRISVVAAFDPTLPRGGFPASEPGVIAVANDSLPWFPSGVYGAPGHDIPTTQPGGKWFLVNGSSYSAAHISGLIALVREDRASMPHMLLVSAQPSSGMVDACATLLRASKNCGCNCTTIAQNVQVAR
jgi:hypothetical protein